jgi:hypothetical protein
MKPKLIDDKGEIVSVEDPFDNLDNLRLTQDFVETVGVKKLLTTIPVRRPNPQDFIRVHADPAYREAFPAIELKDERELYVVNRNMQAELSTECVSATLFTTINRQGVVSLSGQSDYRARTGRPTSGGEALAKRPSWQWRNGFASKRT